MQRFRQHSEVWHTGVTRICFRNRRTLRTQVCELVSAFKTRRSLLALLTFSLQNTVGGRLFALHTNYQLYVIGTRPFSAFYAIVVSFNMPVMAYVIKIPTIYSKEALASFCEGE